MASPSDSSPHPPESDAPSSGAVDSMLEAAPPPSRRDFIYITAAAVAAVGVGVTAWPFLNSLAPAADTLALSTTEVDLAPIQEGQAITVLWQGKPVFIRRRTAADMAAATAVDNDPALFASLRDKQKDAERVKQSTFNGKAMPQWLVMVGVCTHLGCIPQGQKPTDMHGDFNGWFCPCHGSNYDTSGRIRKGPAPKNLAIPTYSFLSETRIKIG